MYTRLHFPKQRTGGTIAVFNHQIYLAGGASAQGQHATIIKFEPSATDPSSYIWNENPITAPATATTAAASLPAVATAPTAETLSPITNTVSPSSLENNSVPPSPDAPVATVALPPMVTPTAPIVSLLLEDTVFDSTTALSIKAAATPSTTTTLTPISLPRVRRGGCSVVVGTKWYFIAGTHNPFFAIVLHASFYRELDYVATINNGGIQIGMINDGDSPVWERTRIVDEYDFETNTWRQLPENKVARTWPAAIHVGGRIYLFGYNTSFPSLPICFFFYSSGSLFLVWL
jgi:hypothetical protein